VGVKKINIIAPIIIGEAVALILLGILKYGSLEFPPFINDIIVKWAKFLPMLLPVLAFSGIFIASFLAKKLLVLFQLAKFILTGVLNTFIDLGILTFLMAVSGFFSGWSYVFFKAFSFTCAVVNSYFWNKFWTYEKKETEGAGKEFRKFYLITGIGFLLNVSIASFIVNIIGPQFGLTTEVWAYIGAILAIICVFMWNFLGYKFIVFKK